jgi:DNA-binding NarL/FixJ family response regulator
VSNTEAMAAVAVSRIEVGTNPVVADSPPLTAREREVLELLVTGMRNKEMARVLGIADDTVRVHVKSIFSKLDVHTRTAAMATALRRGLVQV